jgi:glutathione peroxidase
MTRLMIAALAAPLALFAGAALAAQTGDDEAARAEAVAGAIAEHQRRFADAPPPGGQGAHAHVFDGLSTPTVPMSAFDGDVVLVVNTASRCGLTPQYEALQAIHGEYGAQGFSVVGVPSGDFREQELETAEEIREFCTLNFGVTFPMAGRTHVIGEDAHPFYRWAEAELGEDAVPQWNFHKLLVGRDGRLLAAFPSRTVPDAPEVRAAIEAALEA